MEFDTRVLVLASNDERVDRLTAGLDALGWRTVTARTVEAAQATLGDFPLEAAIVDADNFTPEVLARLRHAAEPRRLPVMVVGARPEAAPGADLAMSKAPHPVQASLRLEQLIRAAIAEEEFRLRASTLAARGVGLDTRASDDPPLRIILAAGAADRRFLALSNALAAGGLKWWRPPRPTPPSISCTRAASTPPSCGAPTTMRPPCPSPRA
ncbi:hypothetical protein [Brevundimonas albigilva]|uniref:hypothetical protein n=1 Tax=Brevundimonas albigilva TaxID=1312364 RepID=UPI003221EEC0